MFEPLKFDCGYLELWIVAYIVYVPDTDSFRLLHIRISVYHLSCHFSMYSERFFCFQFFEPLSTPFSEHGKCYKTRQMAYNTDTWDHER